ncbi:DUF3298 domain-containing protein [uncultured Aquimarina sp.]|uniref:DUF3298 domain-containing protein n=1 Tax=uncultured Aquimarina sp. TaxID=575652 RepID=UPI002634F6B6|nr:DUF3298 domain-containing protein [uncultured Aquimarina sp.]
MRTLITSFVMLSLIACNNKTQIKERPETYTTQIEKDNTLSEDSIQYLLEERQELHQEKTKSTKVERLMSTKDDEHKLQRLVIDKQFYKAEDVYILDYKYPYLNENMDENNSVFNDFLTENYLNIEATENEILEDKVLFCDSLAIGRCMDKRIIDYKIYTVKRHLISVLLYKENYYSGMKHSTYMFECLNYDIENHEFLYYDDFFVDNSESELLSIINTVISDGINSGDLYYECWQLSKEDFRVYKNNFVITEDVIKFYFDDCIICPSYTGTYAIEILINDVIHLIKKYNNKPLIG